MGFKEGQYYVGMFLRCFCILGKITLDISYGRPVEMSILNKYPISSKYLETQASANSMDFNQTASKGAV